MIAIDLCKVNYQTLLITYLKLTKKNVWNARGNVKLLDLNYRCKNCKKRCTKSKDGLIKKFSRIYKFCNGDLDKIVLLQRKDVYPYEYMDSWERFDEVSLPDREVFYSKLNLKDITDKDYEHPQKVWSIFRKKKSWRVS